MAEIPGAHDHAAAEPAGELVQRGLQAILRCVLQQVELPGRFALRQVVYGHADEAERARMVELPQQVLARRQELAAEMRWPAQTSLPREHPKAAGLQAYAHAARHAAFGANPAADALRGAPQMTLDLPSRRHVHRQRAIRADAAGLTLAAHRARVLPVGQRVEANA